MLTFFLLVPLFALQAPADPEPESWPSDTVFEWEVNYWEWQGEKGAKTNQIPKNARMIAGVKLYEKFGRRAYASVDVGEETTLRVALVPKDVDRSLGLFTDVCVAIFRPKPQNGASHGWIKKTGVEVTTKDWKFGERIVFGDSSFGAGGTKRACYAYTLTIRKRERGKKGLIEDYFSNPWSPENEKEWKRFQSDHVPRSAAPDR